MDLLIIGGTVFVGRAVAEATLARGHRVSLFHRGSKGTGQIPGAEEVLGDRDGGLEALAGKQFDAVIDTCGYVPRLVRDSAQALQSADRYLFVSTISVYEETEDGLREYPVEEPVGTEEVTNESYGPLKVECEREVRAAFGDRATIVRPGLIYGPYDPTNRFPHWVRRFLNGGEVLVPDVPDAALQQVDARDLGNFMLDLIERGVGGTFDVVGERSTFGAMIDACQTLNPEAKPVLASEEALEKAGLRLGWDLPLAYPGRVETMRIEPTAALAEGLRRRPLAETLNDTAAWIRATGPDEKPRFGLSPEREQEAIIALKEEAS